MEVLKAERREKLGTRSARKLRAQGKVPGIIYGHGEEPVAFVVDGHDLALAMQHGERVVEMELDGTRENYLIKEAQHDTFGTSVLHVDFARVSLDETVTVTVAIVLRGTPAGEVEGGILVPGLSELEVECLVTKIPEEIRVRVNDLKVGDALHVRDLPAMEGVVFLDDPDAIIASCRLVEEEEEVAPAAEGEEAAQPEVIGKGKRDEEEGEEA